MNKPQLAIVIHAEEEFDWDKGFYRSNTNVSHGDGLIEVMDGIIARGGKVTLAMDYPFVTSDDGQKVIKHFRPFQGNKIEFAAHLHPWVNPPYQSDDDRVPNAQSFPGNLDKEWEFRKLKLLTETIEQISGSRPTTYLAGRYGIGGNSADILKSLGYRVDLSISAYSDFTTILGPNFSCYSNQKTDDGQLVNIPHTCSVVAPLRWIADYFNKNPQKYHSLRCNKVFNVILKLLRVKMYRLSPEGFSFEHMKRLTMSQLRVGQQQYVLSFHSPSAKVGCTPYVQNQHELEQFKLSLFSYIKWFNNLTSAPHFLPSEYARSQNRSN